MLERFLGIRREDRRDTIVAFCTLAAMMAAHAMLETTRDALFLAKLPAHYLPLAYIGIAMVALLVSKLNEAATARYPRQRLLAISLVMGGIVTCIFWQLTVSRATWALLALYIWTGVLATVVVVQFWLLLGDTLDVQQAKRVFSIIGAGGLVGATLGSGTATALLAVTDAPMLLLVAGGVFMGSAIIPLGFTRSDETEAPRRRAARPISDSPLKLILRDAYLTRLFLMVLFGTVLFTGIDYVFKATVVAEAQQRGWEIGSVFARFYAAVNFLSLIVQILIAPRLLRLLGASRALLILPALLLLGAFGFVATGTVMAAFWLKGGDGALRHSVHKTASEILYLPLQKQVRERFKGVSETLGSRGGQALASVIILGITFLTRDARIIAGGLVVLCIAWVIVMRGLESQYLELFRRQLRDGTLVTEVDVPDLDLASFEVLVSALSGEDDSEVLAALDMFETYGKRNLVPALILYHPSRTVVLRAFDMFAKSDRADVRRLTGRLLKHEDAEIRAAALRTLAATRPDEELLRSHFEDESPMVRCTALVALIIAGYIDDGEATGTLRKMVEGDSAETRRALARALRHLPEERFGWVAEELAVIAEPGLGTEVARSIAAAPHPRYVPVLVDMLERRDARAEARRALLGLGVDALEQLGAALKDDSRPREQRLHLPRTISRFREGRAAEILLEVLPHEKDEGIVYKILRGLGRMRALDPSIPIDKKSLFDVARRTLESAVKALHWRLAVGRVVAWKQEAMTPAAELLIAYLDEKRDLAIQRTFRLLHIIEPTQEFRIIHDALKGKDKKAKASGLELLSHVVPSPLKEGILAMVDDVAPRPMLKAAREFYDPPGRDLFAKVMARVDEAETAENLKELGYVYADTLREMLADPSEVLRSIVGYHVAELGLEELLREVKGAAQESTDVLGQIADRALGMFSVAPPEPELSGA